MPAPGSPPPATTAHIRNPHREKRRHETWNTRKHHPSRRHRRGRRGRVARAGRHRIRRHPDRVHRGRGGGPQALRRPLQRGPSGYRDQVGPGLHRHRHREAPRREGQPQGRRHLGAGGDEPAAHEVGGHAPPLQAEGHRKAGPEVHRQGRPSDMDRHGRLGRGHLREHGGAGEARIPDADVVEGPHQVRVQGPRGDAEPELLRHRLPRRLELAADVR